ncbi:MAG: AraC family transcriptional regulator [Kofleriaceae bacterium]
MSDDARRAYGARMGVVLTHIDAHLGEEVTVDALALVARSSKFHFARQFTALYGVPPRRYVQLRRLQRAGEALAFRPWLSVLEIATTCGYEGPEAFARAFKQLTGQSPSAFRRGPDWRAWHDLHRPTAEIWSTHMTTLPTPADVEIVTTPPRTLAVLEHRGDPATLGASLQRFIAWRRPRGLSPARAATFNLWYEDPDQVAPEAFRLDLGVEVTGPVEANPEGLVARELAGGRCARLRHVGSDHGLRAAATFLYCTWLPASGCELRDAPLFVHRVSFGPDVAQDEEVCDLYLPLAPG